MALALSIRDNNNKSAAGPSTTEPAPAAASSSSAPPTAQTQAPASQAIPSGTSASTVSRVRALYDFQPSEPGELQFRKGDIIFVLESVYKDWWKGSLRGQTGIFPLNYVEKLPDPTPEDLQREAQMEAEVFGQVKNVEKLLTLLSTSSSDLNIQDNEEITTLYHQTLAIRPKLIELIAKYSQKKGMSRSQHLTVLQLPLTRCLADEFTQLNEKFIKARRDYEALLEASMAHSAQSQQYGRPPQPGYGYPHAGASPAGASHAGAPHAGVPGYPPGPHGPSAPVQHDPGQYYHPQPRGVLGRRFWQRTLRKWERMANMNL